MSGATHRRKKFLVVVDDTPECRVALRFAALRARNVGGGVTLLRVYEPPDFQHWMGVGELMRQEAQEEAEALLRALSAQVFEETGIMPEIVIEEGSVRDVIQPLIENDRDIRILVLGASPDKAGPGPLVNFLVGELSGHFSIPITVVPGTLTRAQIEELT